MDNKVSQIQKELQQEIKTHDKLSKRYKKCHRILGTTEFILNMTSMACHSTALVNLVSSLGTLTIIFSTLGIATNGLSVFCSQLDRRKFQRLNRHQQLLRLCQKIECEIIEKFLNDEDITQDDFKGIIDSMQKYYNEKEQIQKKYRAFSIPS